MSACGVCRFPWAFSKTDIPVIMRSSRVLPKRCVEIFRCLGIIPLSLLVGGIHLHTLAHTRPLTHTHFSRARYAENGVQHRDIPSASELHRLQLCGCVACFEQQLSVDWLFDAFGPIVLLCRRGFNRSGGGERLQTYKKVFENSVAAAKQRCLARCCVNMSTSLGHASVGLWDPEKVNFQVSCAQRHCWPLFAHRRSCTAPDERFT